jgi:hypothetical protein
MSGKGGNPKDKVHSKKKNNVGNKKPWRKKHQSLPEQRKKDPEEISVLRYGHKNNFT